MTDEISNLGEKEDHKSNVHSGCRWRHEVGMAKWIAYRSKEVQGWEL